MPIKFFKHMLLKLIIIKAEIKIPGLIKKLGFNCKRVFHIGAIDINPESLAIWIVTQTDKEKIILRNNYLKINSEVKGLLIEAGYPIEAINYTGVDFESQETVDRDYKGSWWNCMK